MVRAFIVTVAHRRCSDDRVQQPRTPFRTLESHGGPGGPPQAKYASRNQLLAGLKSFRFLRMERLRRGDQDVDTASLLRDQEMPRCELLDGLLDARRLVKYQPCRKRIQLVELSSPRIVPKRYLCDRFTPSIASR